MLIFLKSACGLQKKCLLFPPFLIIEHYIFQIFTRIFHQQNATINVFFHLTLSPTQRLRFSDTRG